MQGLTLSGILLYGSRLPVLLSAEVTPHCYLLLNWSRLETKRWHTCTSLLSTVACVLAQTAGITAALTQPHT